LQSPIMYPRYFGLMAGHEWSNGSLIFFVASHVGKLKTRELPTASSLMQDIDTFEIASAARHPRNVLTTVNFCRARPAVTHQRAVPFGTQQRNAKAEVHGEEHRVHPSCSVMHKTSESQ
jgi:hypothetical protein